MLQPVDIDDNQPASGTDDISCTVPSTAGGYQPANAPFLVTAVTGSETGIVLL